MSKGKRNNVGTRKGRANQKQHTPGDPGHCDLQEKYPDKRRNTSSVQEQKKRGEATKRAQRKGRQHTTESKATRGTRGKEKGKMFRDDRERRAKKEAEPDASQVSDEASNWRKLKRQNRNEELWVSLRKIGRNWRRKMEIMRMRK